MVGSPFEMVWVVNHWWETHGDKDLQEDQNIGR
jgi:hypothetical protein